MSHDGLELETVRRGRIGRQRQPEWGRWIGVTLLVVAAGFFSFLNSGERVTLNVGVATLYRISLVGLVFVVFLLGMVAMFLFGIRHDREIRQVLGTRDRLTPDHHDPSNSHDPSNNHDPPP